MSHKRLQQKSVSALSPAWRHLLKCQKSWNKLDEPCRVLVIVRKGPFVVDAPVALVWVEVTDHTDGVFTGTVLTVPGINIPGVEPDNQISFIAPEGWEYPLMVSSKYLKEVSCWSVGPCGRCGSTLLMDTPSDLFDLHDAGPSREPPILFTAFCYLCGGSQTVSRK